MAQDASTKQLAVTTPPGAGSAARASVPPALPPSAGGPPPLPPGARPGSAPPPPAPPGASAAPLPAAAQATGAAQATNDQPDADAGPESKERRSARRRAAGPSRPQIAANDDLPSIGGLIFALHQKPSQRPIQVAAIASVVWLLIGGLLGLGHAGAGVEACADADGNAVAADRHHRWPRPSSFRSRCSGCWPCWSWRAQELKLMSSAMTEVAIRLAEPDRMAEQQIASRRPGRPPAGQPHERGGRRARLAAPTSSRRWCITRWPVSSAPTCQNEHRIRGAAAGAVRRAARAAQHQRAGQCFAEGARHRDPDADRRARRAAGQARPLHRGGRTESSIALEIARSREQRRAPRQPSVGQHGGAARRAHRPGAADRQRMPAHAAARRPLSSTARSSRGSAAQCHEHHSAIVARTDSIAHRGMDAHAALSPRCRRTPRRCRASSTRSRTASTPRSGARTEGLQTVLEEYTRALDQTLARPPAVSSTPS